MGLPDDQPTSPNLPQADASSNTWDPSTISNIIFSTIMLFIGIIAIWQAHKAHLRSSRALDQEELIGMHLLSRVSTTPSNASNEPTPTSAIATREAEHVSASVATADTVGNVPVAAHSCV